ncbi:MAG TPA: low molecular weight protein-tyrosine-phosphatase [Casimicrobiaceae bacterium]|nr:low molecular weight protein-tyrosine-phosphatase [Casimicrobiaceae bacterium]
MSLHDRAAGDGGGSPVLNWMKSLISPPQRIASVLFVCTGNICRSPTAEAVFRAMVKQEGLADRVVIDSAGTHDHQLGQRPDPRAMTAARRRGYELDKLRARLVEPEDFKRFDWILAMDRRHLEYLESMRPADYRGHLGLFLALVGDADGADADMPDPYYGDPGDFERVLDLTVPAAAALLRAILEGSKARDGA